MNRIIYNRSRRDAQMLMLEITNRIQNEFTFLTHESRDVHQEILGRLRCGIERRCVAATGIYESVTSLSTQGVLIAIRFYFDCSQRSSSATRFGRFQPGAVYPVPPWVLTITVRKYFDQFLSFVLEFPFSARLLLSSQLIVSSHSLLCFVIALVTSSQRKTAL